MAYCKQCGAYIPDGLSACLACGFDEDASAAAAAQQTKTAEKTAEETLRLRRQMEEQRARQQEQSRKWAEQEAQRRQARQEAQQKAQNKTDSTVRGTKIPYSSQGDKTKHSTGFDFSDFTGKTDSATGATSASAGKLFAVMSYLSALCFIPLLICKDDEFAMFHAKQGLSLFIVATLGNILGGILGFGWLFTVAQVFLALKGIVNALDGKTKPLPYIGTLFKF